MFSDEKHMKTHVLDFQYSAKAKEQRQGNKVFDGIRQITISNHIGKTYSGHTMSGKRSVEEMFLIYKSR